MLVNCVANACSANHDGEKVRRQPPGSRPKRLHRRIFHRRTLQTRFHSEHRHVGFQPGLKPASNWKGTGSTRDQAKEASEETARPGKLLLDNRRWANKDGGPSMSRKL